MKTATLAADHITDPSARQELVELFDQPLVKRAMVDPHTEEGQLSSSSWWEALFQSSPQAASVKSKAESAAGSALLSKAVINARHAGTGASLAARKRVYGDPRTLCKPARFDHHTLWVMAPPRARTLPASCC